MNPSRSPKYGSKNIFDKGKSERMIDIGSRHGYKKELKFGTRESLVEDIGMTPVSSVESKHKLSSFGSNFLSKPIIQKPSKHKLTINMRLQERDDDSMSPILDFDSSPKMLPAVNRKYTKFNDEQLQPVRHISPENFVEK